MLVDPFQSPPRPISPPLLFTLRRQTRSAAVRAIGCESPSFAPLPREDYRPERVASTQACPLAPSLPTEQ